MTNNTKQGLIVSIGFLAILLTVGVVMMINSMNRNRDYVLSMIKANLERPWQEALTVKSNAVNQGVVSITPGELSAAFYGTNRWPHDDTPTNFWIAKEPVKSMSTDIVCAMSMSDNGAYAVDANGGFRELTKEEFAAWPHLSPQEAQATNEIRH